MRAPRFSTKGIRAPPVLHRSGTVANEKSELKRGIGQGQNRTEFGHEKTMEWAGMFDKFLRECTENGRAPSTKRRSRTRTQTNARSLFRFLEGFGEGGHNFEDIADDTVVSDFENRRVLIFVDRDNGAGALHADNMLDCAADTQRKIKFRGDGLAGAADLALHGEPAFVADGTRGGNFRAQSLGDGFCLGNVFRSLDATTDSDDERGLGEVNCGF